MRVCVEDGLVQGGAEGEGAQGRQDTGLLLAAGWRWGGHQLERSNTREPRQRQADRLPERPQSLGFRPQFSSQKKMVTVPTLRAIVRGQRAITVSF